MKSIIFIAGFLMLLGCEQKVKASKNENNNSAKTDNSIVLKDTAATPDTSNTPVDTAVAKGNPSRKIPENFALAGLDGNTYDLSEQKGKVVFVSFWAPWCPPCRAEIPVLMELYEKYNNEGFVILGIGLDKEKTLKDFAAKNKINYPVLVGNETVAQSYKVNGIPATFIIDKSGRIANSHVGFGGKETKKELEAELLKLLKE